MAWLNIYKKMVDIIDDLFQNDEQIREEDLLGEDDIETLKNKSQKLLEKLKDSREINIKTRFLNNCVLKLRKGEKKRGRK